MSIFFLYVIFSLTSIVLNLVAQYILLLFYKNIYISILVGTFLGLIVKYILDKKYIFNVNYDNKSSDLTEFFLYSLMGIFTTFIFWFFEILFHFLFEKEIFTYIGGALGLSIGYIIKYNLDKRFVFNSKAYNE